MKLEGTPSSSLDLEQIWFVLREKAWLILLCMLLGIFAGLAYIYRTPLTYQAVAVIEVDPEPVRVIGYNDVPEAKDPISPDMVQTMIAVFHSRQFAEEVINNYQLLKNPAFITPGPNGEPPALGDAVGELIGAEQIFCPPETRFINVGVTHSDPMMAKVLADMLANHFVRRSMDEQKQAAQTQIDYLKSQAQDASEELMKSKQALNDYRKSHGAAGADSLVDSHDTVVTDLKSKSGELEEAKAELIRLEADDDQAQLVKNDPVALLAIPTVASDPSIMEYTQLIDELKGRIQVLALRYTDLHPKMILAKTQLADAEANLKQAVLKVPDLIHSKRLSEMTRVAEFDQAVQAQQQQAMNLEDLRVKYDVLQQNVDTNQAAFDGILNRLKELNVATGLDDSNGMHIFEPAQVPMEPKQARKSKTLCLGMVGGIVLGMVLSFGLHMMDSSVKTVDQAEDVLGLTVLAAIPRQGQSRLRESGLALIKAPGSPVAEAFRSLRTSIFLAGKSKGRKIILFTSALSGEGKTFCSTNYATSLAQQGLSTLLIDADLRSPMIRTVMLSNRKVAGLGELLSRKCNAAAATHESEIENLWVMPAGDLLPNPAELLARTDVGEIVRQLGDKFERIVIDTAPVTAVSDTLLLLEHAQAICLVTNAGKTPRKWIMRAIKLITEAGSRPVGIILNQLPMRMAGAYSYYPGKYGEPEVYGSANGSYLRKRPPADEPQPAETEVPPRF